VFSFITKNFGRSDFPHALRVDLPTHKSLSKDLHGKVLDAGFCQVTGLVFAELPDRLLYQDLNVAGPTQTTNQDKS
jgi:hypothetical protein